jgi:hypothetical protein
MIEEPHFDSRHEEESFLSPKPPQLLWNPFSLLFNGVKGLFLRRQSGRDVNLPRLFSAQVKDACSWTSTSLCAFVIN